MAVKGQDLSQQLINIHSVSNIAAMNAIANPNNQSLSYVESEQLTYQFIDGNWVPFKELSLVSYIDSIITIALGTNPNICCPNAPNEVGPAVGDLIGCGIVVHTNTDGEHGLIMALDNQWNRSFGCNSDEYNQQNPSYHKLKTKWN